MVYRAEFDAMLNHEKQSFAFFKEDLEMSEFYLLRKSLCDQTGKVIFDDDDEKFEAFLDVVTDDIGNEILMEILKFNHIIDFDKTDSIKKK